MKFKSKHKVSNKASTRSRYYAIYQIQPDDRNHLIVYDKDGETIVYVRPGAEELKELLNGSAGFVERGVYSEEARKNYYRVAQMFKNRMIDHIIFQSYPMIEPKFKYIVKPENIEIQVRGLFNREYILDLDDKTVVIRPYAKSTGGYPFSVEVEEIPKKKVKESIIGDPIVTIEKSLDKLTDDVLELMRYLMKLKSYETRYRPIINDIAENLKKIRESLNKLKKNK